MEETTQGSWIQDRIELFEAACFKEACRQALGVTRLPKNEEESALVGGKLRSIASRSGIFRYIPHAKQEFFHNTHCRITSFFGGNQSGKTLALLCQVLSWVLNFRPWDNQPVYRLDGSAVEGPVKALIGAQDYVNAISNNIHPKLEELVPFDVVVDRIEKLQGIPSKIIFKPEFGGGFIKYMSYTGDDRSWEGHTWDIATFDEPMPYAKYTATERGCVASDAPIYLSMTMINEPWITDTLTEDGVEIWVPDDMNKLDRSKTAILYVDMEENTHIDEQRRNEFLKMLDPDEREARKTGRPLHLSGVIYKEFRDELHILPSNDMDEMYPAKFEGDFFWKTWPSL